MYCTADCAGEQMQEKCRCCETDWVTDWLTDWLTQHSTMSFKCMQSVALDGREWTLDCIAECEVWCDVMWCDVVYRSRDPCWNKKSGGRGTSPSSSERSRGSEVREGEQRSESNISMIKHLHYSIPVYSRLVYSIVVTNARRSLCCWKHEGSSNAMS